MTFEEFAADRLPGVLRFAAVLTGDRALAEDLAQKVLAASLLVRGPVAGTAQAARPLGARALCVRRVLG
jgi:hypothetical protein